MITKPVPFQDAVRFLLEKEQLPAEWDAREWQAQEPDFRTRAFWSAKVENARFIDRAQGLIFDYLAEVRDDITTPAGDRTTALRVGGREHFVKMMREFMIGEGMAKESEFKTVNQKDVTDIRSLSRLRLMFDTNVRQAYGYGQWKQGMTPAVLAAYPAAKLIRDRGVKEPRPRHQANLGEIRLKTDPRWALFHNDPEIGGFGVPWGPYGFNSGVTQEDVSREKAEKLGLNVDSVAPAEGSALDGLRASVKGMDPALKAKLLEELRSGPSADDAIDAAREAGRKAAAGARREMLHRGLTDAVGRGDAARAEKYREALDNLAQTGKGMTVHDDGDMITLDDSLEERLAKVVKRGDQSPEAELAISTKIFETVDRKAAEPKTRPESQKGVARAKQLMAENLTLTPEERRILQSPHEILLIHTPDGRLKSVTLGNRNEVTIPDLVPTGAILSHQHPSGRGPSSSDLKYVLLNPGRTLRIVAVNENGKIEAFSMKSIESIDYNAIEDTVLEFKTACESMGDTHDARRKSLSLILRNIGGMVESATAIIQ